MPLPTQTMSRCGGPADDFEYLSFVVADLENHISEREDNVILERKFADGTPPLRSLRHQLGAVLCKLNVICLIVS